jgi:hypothetical protein
MSSERRTVPLSSYLETHYVVFLGEREVTVRVGRTAPELDAVLDALDVTSGVFITAANPRSEWQSEGANAAANARMAALLHEGNWRVLPHVGRSADGDWAEEGFFVLDLDPRVGLALAEGFGQFAIVTIERSLSARLLLTDLARPDAGDEEPGLSPR